MKVATGTIVDGKVVVEGEALAEGETVTVLLCETSETFELTREEEDGLLESIASMSAANSFRGKSCWSVFVVSGERSAQYPGFRAGPRSRSRRLVMGGRRIAQLLRALSGMTLRKCSLFLCASPESVRRPDVDASKGCAA